MPWIRQAGVSWISLFLCIQPAEAQNGPDSQSDAARIATEIPFLSNLRGAGGDPQTSVAQPDVSARPSANLTTSIQDLLGPNGDPGGLRSILQQRGVTFSLSYIGESFGNVTGGSRRGAIYEGLLDLQFDADLDKLMGWQGASIHANLYQIHGRGLSRSFIGNFITVSAIEALPASRLYELWFEQTLFDEKLSLRVGQLASDTEFAVSQTGTLFLNSTFGWPNIMAVILPSGGPIYPLATPGIRAKYVPNKNFSLQVGLFNGDPAGAEASGQSPEPERRNRTGTNFRTNDPALIIAEAAYAYGLEPEDNIEPGTVTLGGWYHFGRFSSLDRDTSGRSLADEESPGVGRQYRGNSGLYAMIDQTVYREPDDPNDGASVFVRASASPSDRNLLDFYMDAGIGYKGLLPGRSDDTVGVAFALSRISRSARRFDTDTLLLTGSSGPRRSSEAVLEATYQAVLGPGVTLQPNFQYIFRPGGGIADPSEPASGRIKNAAVFGLRATIRY